MQRGPACAPTVGWCAMGRGLVSYDNTDLFRLVFRIEGSIFDNVFPKVIASVILSFFAAFLRSSLGWFETTPAALACPVSPLAFVVTGSSIAFLLVFPASSATTGSGKGAGTSGRSWRMRETLRQAAFCVRLDDGPADVDKDVGKVTLSHVQRGNAGFWPVRRCAGRAPVHAEYARLPSASDVSAACLVLDSRCSTCGTSTVRTAWSSCGTTTRR